MRRPEAADFREQVCRDCVVGMRRPDVEAIANQTPVPAHRQLSATERAVADIWAEVLGLARVDVNDDFFDRGGHSLLAVRAIARARAVLRVAVPLRLLLENPRLVDFAAAVDRLGQGARP